MNTTPISLCPERDRRQRYLGELLQKNGYNVLLAETEQSLDVEAASIDDVQEKAIVLLPIPASEVLLTRLEQTLTSNHIVLGGNLPKSFTDFCINHEIIYIDYLTYEAVAIENAVATAEGAICQAILTSDINLHQSRSLVIGYGKCGEILADKLSGLKSNVTISTRDECARAKAKAYGYQLHKDSYYSDYQLIFNTAPAMVITPNIIDLLCPDTIIIDIASRPGGTDFNYCIKKGIIAKHCPGLPGKYSPKTSAKIIFDQIYSVLPAKL